MEPYIQESVDLIRSGVMKKKNRPLWFDIMTAFPPITPPSFEQTLPEKPVKDILYPEDVIRAKFYEEFGTHQLVDLKNHDAIKTSPCQRFIFRYQQLEESSTISKEDLFEETIRSLVREGFLLRRLPGKAQGESGRVAVDTKGLAHFFQEALTKSNQPDS